MAGGQSYRGELTALTKVANRVKKMPLTRDFRETVMELCKDSEYRKEMLIGVLELYIEGDFDIAYSKFRDYLNATNGFSAIADKMQMHGASLRRMFGKNGNPTGRNFATAFRLALEQEGLTPSDVVAHRDESVAA